MKKTLLTLVLAVSACSSLINAQVGINTATPAATMDITAKNASGTTNNVDGLLVPRVNRERAFSMTSIPTSTLIYVNSIVGPQSGITANIDAVGYYYFNGTLWVKLNPTVSNVNIYTSDGTLQGNRIVTQGANTLTFNSTVANGFSVAGNTFSVDGANNRVGIGTNSPTNKLEINNGNTAGAIKIVDGTQGANKVLMSDANGVGKWSNLPGSWFGLLNNGTSNSSSSQINFTSASLIGQGGAANASTDAITIPSTGLYEVTVSGWTWVGNGNTPGAYLTTWIIARNSVTIATPHYASPTGIYGTETSCTNYLTLNAGDVITLSMNNIFASPQPADKAQRVALAIKLIQ